MRRLLILGGVLLAGAVGAGIAIAVNPAATTLGDTNAPREKIVRTEFTPTADQPTFSPGWHEHHGVAIVQVQEGQLTIFQHCRKNKLHRGDTYIETPYVPVNALAKGHVVWTTTLILWDSLAPGGPTAVPSAEPSCSNADDD